MLCISPYIPVRIPRSGRRPLERSHGIFQVKGRYFSEKAAARGFFFCVCDKILRSFFAFLPKMWNLPKF